MHDDLPLQDRLHQDALIRHCYGCGANNVQGLKIKSYLEGDQGICRWTPQPHHCSYPGYLNGGVACTLIDCHSIWTAFALECRDQGIDMGVPNPPTGWTRAMNVEFLKPTPLGVELRLKARVIKKGRTSRTITCSIYANNEECVRAEIIAVMTNK
jgi:acyl-coenzyme A thioesterase PaaI-like protein